MTSKIVPFTLGPIENNSYLYIDVDSKKSIIVDPSFGSKVIVDYVFQNSLELIAIWCTHAHFDHISGVNEIIPLLDKMPEIVLHKDDLILWRENGGASIFGYPFHNKYQPTTLIDQNQVLSVGEQQFNIRHTPGHTSGHVIFHHPEEKIVFCGDLIFHSGVGRTDLPGGNHAQLIESIKNEILTLPDTTRLYSGHGEMTTVARERIKNPFLIF